MTWPSRWNPSTNRNWNFTRCSPTNCISSSGRNTLGPRRAASSATNSPRQNYILYGKTSVTFRLVEDYFRREDMGLNAVLKVGSMEATKELVKLGLGGSVLAPWIARKELDERSLVALPLGRRKLQRRWGVLHWRGKRLTLAEDKFIRLCETACGPLQAKAGGAME